MQAKHGINALVYSVWQTYESFEVDKKYIKLPIDIYHRYVGYTEVYIYLKI